MEFNDINYTIEQFVTPLNRANFKLNLAENKGSLNKDIFKVLKWCDNKGNVFTLGEFIRKILKEDTRYFYNWALLVTGNSARVNRARENSFDNDLVHHILNEGMAEYLTKELNKNEGESQGLNTTEWKEVLKLIDEDDFVEDNKFSNTKQTNYEELHTLL